MTTGEQRKAQIIKRITRERDSERERARDSESERQWERERGSKREKRKHGMTIKQGSPVLQI